MCFQNIPFAAVTFLAIIVGIVVVVCIAAFLISMRLLRKRDKPVVKTVTFSQAVVPNIPQPYTTTHTTTHTTKNQKSTSSRVIKPEIDKHLKSTSTTKLRGVGIPQKSKTKPSVTHKRSKSSRSKSLIDNSNSVKKGRFWSDSNFDFYKLSNPQRRRVCQDIIWSKLSHRQGYSVEALIVRIKQSHSNMNFLQLCADQIGVSVCSVIQQELELLCKLNIVHQYEIPVNSTKLKIHSNCKFYRRNHTNFQSGV